MLVSGLILALYFWVFFSGASSITAVLFVDDKAAIAAGVAFLVAAISYAWTPRKYLLVTAIITYSLLIAMISLLMLNTGEFASPFVVLWMIAALFSPVFGWYGMVLILVVLAGYLGYSYYSGSLDIVDIATPVFVTLVPVAIGALSWRGNHPEDEEDRTFNQLASELSNVSNKSDVVIAAIADGVLALNKNGVIQLINPAAQALIGWGKNDAVGLDYKSVLKIVDTHDKPVDESNDPIFQAISTNKPVHTDQFSLLTADSGKKFLASITASPIGSMGSGTIIVFRDVTSEKAEEREQAEFISTASHEMRTPVASIEGYLGLVLNPSTAQIDEKAREYITKAQESAQHLGRLFQDLLDVSRADDGRLSNHPKIVDAVPFFQDIITGLRPKAEQKGLRIIYKPIPEYGPDQDTRHERGEKTLSPVLYINVDNDHLREVLSNLVENAIKYTPAGSVTIDVKSDDTHITFSIADSGIGIPTEDIPHLFQKFYRVDNSETREIGGTGLGLYLSRKLVEAMGGKVWADSEYKRGSTFFVRLPRVEHSEARRLIEQKSKEAEAAAKHEPPQITLQPTPTPISTLQPPVQDPPQAAPTPQPITQPTPPVQASFQTTAPAPQPTAPMNPVPQPIQQIQPAPAPQPPRVPPLPIRPNTAPVFRPNESRPNTPLSEIEQNRRQYVRPTDGGPGNSPSQNNQL